MSRKHTQITTKLQAQGAAWAVRSDKYVCTNHNCCNVLEGARAAYHIHPDRSHPHENSVLRFTSLAAIEEWLDE